MKQVCPEQKKLFLPELPLLLALFLLLIGPVDSCASPFEQLLGDNPPDELDLMTGYYAWQYHESAGDSDSASMVPVRGRFIAYWKHLVYGVDAGYESTFGGTYQGAFGGTYQGALQNLSSGSTTPYRSSMAENMLQGAGHLGITWTGLGTRWDFWGSAGYHQQLWMTPGPAGYEEIYHIPFLGATLYEQTPITGHFMIFSEAGFRGAVSPNVTIGLFNSPTLGLGNAINVHARLGMRYFFNDHWGTSLDMTYSNWAFTHSANTPVPGTSPQVLIQEPDSTTAWWGPEAGIIFFF